MIDIIHLFNGVVELKRLCSLIPMLLTLGAAQAENSYSPLDPESFKTCLVALQKSAKTQGLSQKAIDTLDQLNFVPQVVQLDRRQPEFSQSFAGYVNKRVTDWRVQQGRELLEEYRPFLEQLTKKYGVPAQYLVAFWGMETNFGNYKGKMPILDSLATLACDHRRGQYFTKELIQALKLKQKYGFDREQMVGSWAGAMGHTQFMPSTYIHYAVDADGDGKADLWNSTKDALASAAYFLQQLGWQPNERWGREVLLPRNFDYGVMGKGGKRTLSQWSAFKITDVNGSPLPKLAMNATLYLPSGHQGPAFLAYKNFDVMMKWNRSTFYALSVGYLADRIVGAGHLTVLPPEHQPISRMRITSIQQKLNELGHDVGKPDGVIGDKTIDGLRAFQKSQGLVADGYPQIETIKALGI